MKTIQFPYGKGKKEYTFQEPQMPCVLTAALGTYTPKAEPRELVNRALAQPVGSPGLEELAKGKKNVVILASDHTRPVPSKVLLPPMLEQIRRGSPDARITILIATGCHRGPTRQELQEKFGQEILERERICIHDCDDRAHLRGIGVLPSGGECEINTLALEADLLVAEGFIEPHFFAGFSGGRKSVLPGIAGRSTVLGNHCAEFIDHPCARTGILEGNPIHADMLWAARAAKLAFILNVVLNEEKQILCAVAGDPEQAHAEGVAFLSRLCAVDGVDADVVITTNGGYPLDQNMYQAVKGMTAAEAAVKQGGVIIMLAQSADGIGGDHFYHQLADEPDIRRTLARFLATARGDTLPDQWQTQILLRVLMHASVIYISDMEDAVVERMHMLPAHSIGQALAMAEKLLQKEELRLAVIPDGVSVIVRRPGRE